MRARVAVWRASLFVSVVGLLWFLSGDVVVVGYKRLTGGEIVKAGFLDALETTLNWIGKLDLAWLPYLKPNPVSGIVLGSAAAILAVLFLRGRPSAAKRGALIGVSFIVLCASLFAIWGVNWHPRMYAEPAFFGWLAGVGLLCATPFLRSRHQIALLHAWDNRPHSTTADLPATLPELPPPLEALVRETRRIRVGLDPLDGLNEDTRRLVWDWERLLADLSTDDAGLLEKLGLEPTPITAAATHDSLVDLDTALARFETTLVAYRSFGFR